MKKLIIGICFLFGLSVEFANAQDLCLNGFTAQDATSMIKLLTANNGPSTKTTCIWFNGQIIKGILNLMSTERGPKGQIPDGIRIYYGMEPTRSQNTVILVSTYPDTVSVYGKMTPIHQDYFKHDSTNALFSLPGLNGEPTNAGGYGQGAELYSKCGTPCAIDKICVVPAGAVHYITRQHAEDMVYMTAATKDTINTTAEWFPLCVLSNINSGLYNGLRIYYGRHPAKDMIYPGRDAFILEFTKSVFGTTINDDVFDCIYPPCVDNLENLLKKYLPEKGTVSDKEYQKKAAALRKYFHFTGTDNGELCPINCTGTTLPKP